MQLQNVDRLDAGQLSALIELVEAATGVDGVAPLSEQVLLDARSDLSTSAIAAAKTADLTGKITAEITRATDAATPAPHFLAYAGTHLAGYAHLELGPDGATAELIVDPADRQQGLGTRMLRALEDALRGGEPGAADLEAAELEAADLGAGGPGAAGLWIWSHGHLDAARAFAAREGYISARELLSMRRSLRSDVGRLPLDVAQLAPEVEPLPQVRLPEGFAARHFVVGQDEDAWLRVNARAFVDHPEQGRMTRLDLDRRIAEPWFDATGFILIEDIRGATPILAASHWTKVVATQDPQVGPTRGEVYVVGVDPAYQGMGLGLAVTVLGLEHLAGRGLGEAVLYVDADNTAAVRTYTRLGFTQFAVDVMYSRGVHPPVPR